MATVLITGGTGMIGTALTNGLLDKGHHVIILSREVHHPLVSEPGGRETLNLSYVQWNIEEQVIDKEAIAKADHIIHLAGAGIADKRWTEKRKQEIIDSRVKSAGLLVKALKEYTNNVKTVISASAIGWYGADRIVPSPDPFTEEFPAAADFLGQTCKKWEESLEPVVALNKRLVRLRTGIVLGKTGGALAEFRKPLRFGIATILGSGKQVISWIHLDDLVRLYIAAIENENMKGSYNAVAPSLVTNKELVVQLARAKKRFYIPVHVPSFLLKIVLGEVSTEVLKSATVSADKTRNTGFIFRYPTLAEAISTF